MILSDTVRRVDDPFMGQPGQQVGSRQPIRRTHRAMPTRLPGSSTNQRRRREGDVMYTSRVASFRPREGIRRQHVDPGVSLTSELGQGGDYQSRVVGRRSTDNWGSTTSSSRRSESLRSDCDYAPSWQNEQHWQQMVSTNKKTRRVPTWYAAVDPSNCPELQASTVNQVAMITQNVRHDFTEFIFDFR